MTWFRAAIVRDALREVTRVQNKMAGDATFAITGMTTRMRFDIPPPPPKGELVLPPPNMLLPVVLLFEPPPNMLLPVFALEPKPVVAAN